MADQIPSDPANQKIADLTQDQLNVSRGQFSKINAQNEALGGVILELAAAQAQAGEIEERQIRREKFYRRRDFIFNQIVSRFQRVAAKKAAIQSENQFEKDLIEQETQANASLSISKSNSIIATTIGFMSKDIARLSDFMMGNKLTEEENRREMLAALKDNDGVGRREFKEKKYQGFLKTLGKVLIGVPFFLIGFFQGYFQQLGKMLKGFATGSKLADKKMFKGFFGKIGTAIKTTFTKLGTGIKTSVTNFFKALGKRPGISKALDGVKTFFANVSRFFKRAIGPRKIKRAIDAVKGVVGKVASFFNTIKDKVANSKGFQRFIKFASKAKALGKIFGKIFFPIKVIMGVFSFVKGFMKGYKEGGIIEGIKQGIFGLFDTIIGSVLELGAKLASFVLKFFGLDNAAEAIKESMAMILDGVKNIFGGLIDLVKAIFTLDGALIMESLGKIWSGIKDIFMAGPNYFMALIKDIFGSNEEGEGGLVNKVKSLYQRIKDFLSAPLEKITGLLNKLNPFVDDSAAEIQEKIAKEQARIARSQAGENEYVGRDEKGIVKSRKKIAELQAKLAQNGAEMAAKEKQNADMRMSNAMTPAPVIINQAVDNSTSAQSVSFQQSNLMDEGAFAIGR